MLRSSFCFIIMFGCVCDDDDDDKILWDDDVLLCDSMGCEVRKVEKLRDGGDVIFLLWDDNDDVVVVLLAWDD